MAILPTPKIPPQHYDMLKSLIPDLPAGYEEYADAESRRSADAMGRGHTVRQIELDTQELRRYLDQTKSPRTRQTLDAFLGEKLSGKIF